MSINGNEDTNFAIAAATSLQPIDASKSRFLAPKIIRHNLIGNVCGYLRNLSMRTTTAAKEAQASGPNKMYNTLYIHSQRRM